MGDFLNPGTALLCKLASVVVHAEELLSHDGHEFDRAALLSSINDPEIVEWVKQMTTAALAPRKRTP